MRIVTIGQPGLTPVMPVSFRGCYPLDTRAIACTLPGSAARSKLSQRA